MKYYFFRKSKRILLLIFLQVLVIILFTIFALIIFYHIIKHAWKEIIYTLLIISYFIIIWWYFSSIIPLIRYFFDILIIADKNIYKFKIWPFFIEDISIIEIYRIQEIKAFTNGFFKVLFNVWELHLVQQNDENEIIHNLDNPKKIAKIIEERKNEIDRKKSLDRRGYKNRPKKNKNSLNS